jgi:hypothetical protein
VFPVEAQMIAVARFSRAFETAMVMPRSLKLPVGFPASHLSQRSIPSRGPMRVALRSGVEPSPRETMGVAAVSGRRSR